MSRFARVAYTESVMRFQEEQGSRAHGRRMGEAVGRVPDELGEHETGFIQRRDGFYLASVSESGWPYVQFRGGPPGFVHVVDDLTLAFADVRGNRQYITGGNVRSDGRVSLFFMDYAHQRRLKLLGHASVRELDADPALTEQVCSVRTDGRVERITVISVEGFDWNCPKHIPRRYSEEDVAKLERENLALRKRLAELGAS